MTNVMYQDLTVKNTLDATNVEATSLDATNVGTNLLTAIRADVYEVGDVYISTNATSPASKYGGTWEQLDEDAYFKIVTSGAGSYGGTSNEHKIPIASLPNADNTVKIGGGEYEGYDVGLTGGNSVPGYIGVATFDVGQAGNGYFLSNPGGNGQAYYPYYYGLYAWVRTA